MFCSCVSHIYSLGKRAATWSARCALKSLCHHAYYIGAVVCFFAIQIRKHRCDSYKKRRPGLHNIRPAGHMRPERSFLVARESFVSSRKGCKSPTSDNWLASQNFFTLQRNRVLWPAANLCGSIWPSGLYELCRPGVDHVLCQIFQLWRFQLVCLWQLIILFPPAK